MNIRILALITLTVVSIASLAHAGKGTTPTGTFTGYWAGYNAPDGPGSTGGALFLSISNDEKAPLAARTPITGFISVPNLREGTFETKTITGTISAKGVIRAKFQGGVLRGRLDRGGHDAGGSIYLNTKRYWALCFWFADENKTPTVD